MPRDKLGKLLVKAGVIDEADLNRALGIQKEEPNLKLGDILVKMGRVEEDELLNFLSKQLCIPYIDLARCKINEEIVKSMPRQLLEDTNAIPLAKESSQILFAVSDPLDVIAIDNLSMVTGCFIHLVIAKKKDIQDALNNIFEGKGQKEIIPEKKKVITPEVVKEEISFSKLIINLRNIGVTEIYIEPREKFTQLKYKLDGINYELGKIGKEQHETLIKKIRELINFKDELIPQEGIFKGKLDGKEVNLFISSLPTLYGERINIRILNISTPFNKISQLGISQDIQTEIENIINSPAGVFIITGTIDSGKSTTFYALLRELSQTNRSIFTIEDKIEAEIEGVNQLTVKKDYYMYLDYLLGQNPDVVCINEIHNKEMLELTLQLALSGILVIATATADNAVNCIMRFLNFGIQAHSLCSCLKAILAQKLLRVLCPYCKEPYDKGGWRLYNSKGCIECNNIGYKGRVAIFELLKIKEGIKELILKKQPTSVIATSAETTGMVPLREQARRKLLEGVTTEDEINRVISTKE